MLQCEQTKGQSVYQHGLSVAEYYRDLIKLIKDGRSVYEWRVPKWLEEYGAQLINLSHSNDVIHEYLIFHDCGKPYCRTVDEEGKVHFPNHANVSKEVYLQISERSDKSKIANLIGWDMAIHTSNANEIQSLCEDVWTQKDALSLVLASFSELHSNAAMFGGIQSVSFKSKWKKVDRRCKQICKHYLT